MSLSGGFIYSTFLLFDASEALISNALPWWLAMFAFLPPACIGAIGGMLVTVLIVAATLVGGAIAFDVALFRLHWTALVAIAGFLPLAVGLHR